MTTKTLRISVAAMIAVLVAAVVYGQTESRRDRWQRMSDEAVAAGLAEPYRGIAIDGEITAGLYRIEATGVSTEPVRAAAERFLASLTEEQRGRTLHPVDDPEWRMWMNQSFYVREGVGLDEMDPEQRDAAFALLGASLSAKGLKLSRDIMKLNHTLGELNDNDFEAYDDDLYWFTIMGEPSPNEPWGWQLDGHHLIINYFVLGDQVVMSPLFVGSEPVVAEAGKYAGVRIMQEEQDAGLALLRSLTAEQRGAAILKSEKDGTNTVGEAFRDNLDLTYAGTPARDFSDEQKDRLLDVIGLYVGNMTDGHAAVRMREIEAHLDDTWFVWIGGTGDDSVYYYRILSPVVLIEFDHQRPANLRHLYPPVPNREHVHAVLRTPNGNDYGKDLLRQHYERYPHGD